jgi:hypothetical protein
MHAPLPRLRRASPKPSAKDLPRPGCSGLSSRARFQTRPQPLKMPRPPPRPAKAIRRGKTDAPQEALPPPLKKTHRPTEPETPQPDRPPQREAPPTPLLPGIPRRPLPPPSNFLVRASRRFAARLHRDPVELICKRNWTGCKCPCPPASRLVTRTTVLTQTEWGRRLRYSTTTASRSCLSR